MTEYSLSRKRLAILYTMSKQLQMTVYALSHHAGSPNTDIMMGRWARASRRFLQKRVGLLQRHQLATEPSSVPCGDWCTRNARVADTSAQRGVRMVTCSR